MTASSAPTSTVSSSATRIVVSTPAAGEGISVSTLSVETSRSGSSTSTRSPSCLSQRVTVPSVTLSPRAGICTEKAMAGRISSSSSGSGNEGLGSAVRVQRFAGQGEVGLAEGLVLGRVGVHERGDVLGLRVPVVDQLRLADQLADPRADHVDAHHRAGGALAAGLDQFDRALGLQ